MIKQANLTLGKSELCKNIKNELKA